ncbi:substrate-binding periplasmic protein [Aliikangiella coralliicola]|uniref:substrate-binding periplasmic protein n=1 Tax=Aliikangiella coralliicola TaxID=2592383 RepID=UPI00143E02C2|nr:ABC transporter substrate-binding protein [Aliikangiella coralliicola]
MSALDKYWHFKTLIKYRAFIILCVCFLPLSANANHAIDNRIKIVTEILPPYQYVGKNEQLDGYAVDVVNTLIQRLNIKIKVEVYPWARAYNYALHKPNVLIFSMARTPLREDKFVWIGKLHHENYSFYSLASGRAVDKANLNEIKPYTIAVTRGTALEQFLSKKNFEYLEKTNNMKHAIKMLYKKRVDLIFGDDFIVKLLTKEMNYDFEQMKAVFKVPEINADLYIAMSKHSDTKLVERVRKAFNRMKNENIIADIKAKWQM